MEGSGIIGPQGTKEEIIAFEKLEDSKVSEEKESRLALSLSQASRLLLD